MNKIFWFALAGILMGIATYFVEKTTGSEITWTLVFSFPLCWSLAGILFYKWDRV